VSGADRRTAIREVSGRLAAGGLPSPEADARWLVDHVIEVAGQPLGCGAALLDGLVARRLAREPVQVITGRTWFRRLELACRSGVFIPRPETEVVAGLAIEAAAAVSASEGPVRVVEACTGTGAIALSIAVEVGDAAVVAGDIDPAALALAATNLARVESGSAGAMLADGSSVRVVRSDLLEGIDPTWRGTLDVLVANPPYLPRADRLSWAPEVAEHDPELALVGGDDGHEVVDALLALAGTWLRPGGTIVIEIDERRGADAVGAAARAGLVDPRLERDLTGAERAVVARRAGR
jgi:release factor glutamine methyltransferase